VATRLVRIQIEPEIKTLTFLPTIFGLVIMMIGDLTSSTLILTSIILRFYVGGCAGSMKRMNELIA
jgi:hypothetical protein